MFDNMKKYLVFSVKSVLFFFFLNFFSNDEKNTKNIQGKESRKAVLCKVNPFSKPGCYELMVNLFNVLLTLRAWYPFSTLKPGT